MTLFISPNRTVTLSSRKSAGRCPKPPFANAPLVALPSAIRLAGKLISTCLPAHGVNYRRKLNRQWAL